MLPLLAAGASLGGGLLSYFANMSAQERAAALQDKQLQELIGIAIPNPKDQQVALEQFVLEGTFSPELETAFKQAPSAMNQITEDPRLKEAQMRALGKMEQLGYSGGLDLSDKADLQQIQLDNATKERGAREALKQRFAAQGQGGSGFELQSQLAAQQGAADRAGQQSLSVAAQAQKRALDAIMQAGQLGGQIRGQEYGMAKDKAQANDVISKFNTTNMQDVNQRNIAAKNAAALDNLRQKQLLSNANVELRNKNQMYNKSLAQQEYENKLRMAQAKGGVYGQQANSEIAQGHALGQLFTGAGNALGNIAMMSGSGQAGAQNAKPIAGMRSKGDPLAYKENWNDLDEMFRDRSERTG